MITEKKRAQNELNYCQLRNTQPLQPRSHKIPFKNSHNYPHPDTQEEKAEAAFHQTSAATHQESLYHNYHNKDSVKLEIASLI